MMTVSEVVKLLELRNPDAIVKFITYNGQEHTVDKDQMVNIDDEGNIEIQIRSGKFKE